MTTPTYLAEYDCSTSRVAGPTAARVLVTVIAIACGLLAAAPLWGPGLVNTRGGGDSPFLLQRTVAMAENLANGTFPPRWMSHAAYDLGYPFFNYYAALPYYVSGGMVALGLDVLSAIQAAQTLGFLLAALAMLLWARKLYRGKAAQALTVVAYTFVPFHMVNVYVRGDSLSEFWAFIWYPLILWALDRVAERPAPGRIVLAALTYGGLVLTHNVSALIFSPFALLWGLVAVGIRHCRDRDASLDAVRNSNIERPVPVPSALRSGQTRRRLVAIGLAFVVGFLLTAWFWLPAVAETGYGQMGSEFTAGYFHYSNHFRGRNLVQASSAFSYSVATDLEAAGPFSMGLVQAALAAIGLGLTLPTAYRSHIRRDRTTQAAMPAATVNALTLAASLAVATFMITPLSKVLWDVLPLLEITQFPWRFLSVQALFTASVTGAIGEVSFLRDSGSDNQRRAVCRVNHWISICLATGAAVLLVAAALAQLQPERLIIQPDEVTHENLLLYESFTGNIGTTIRYEYLPEDVVPRLYLSEAVVDGAGSPIAEGGLPLQAKLISRQSNHQVWQVALPDGPASVAFPLNWWPDWDATVDGVPTACTPMPGSGRASVVLPSGEHAVTLTLHPTPLRRLATWLSAVTAVVSLLAVGAPTVRGQASPSRPRLPRLARAVALALVLAVASLAGPLLGRQATESAAPAVTPAATFFDFSQMPYPHQGPIDFGIAELAAVEFGSQHSSGRTARPGDTIDVVLSWSKLPTTPLTATLSVVSPAQPRHNVDYTLTRITMPVEMTTRMQIELPLDLARGLYLLHLRLRSPAGVLTAHTARGRTMGELFVGALRIPEGAPLAPDTTVVAVYRDLILHDVEVWQETATDLAVRLSWSTQGTPRNWRLSLRVLDATGRLVTQQDHQPGYGYLPTTLWHPGELVVDTARLQIPEGQAPGDYTLRIITYLQATGEGGGEHDSPIQLTTPTLYDIREACCEQTRKGATILCQTPEVALLTVLAPDSIAEGDDLTLQAEWNALLAPARDLSARWQVTAPDGKTVAEVEQPLARGSRSSEWPRFAWVLAHVDLDLPDQLDAGPYNLALTLTDAEGDVKACGVVGDLAILPHPRVFELPDLPTAQTARFGGIVQLLGYETVLDRRNRTLDLTIWWQATASPRADFKRFVHLYDPATESILAQDDAMPRDWQYPTSWWAAGEIVSETIALDIAGIPSGSYRLGIGWYEPTTVTRLPATLADGTPAPAGRVTLEQSVVLRPGDRLRWPWSRP